MKSKEELQKVFDRAAQQRPQRVPAPMAHLCVFGRKAGCCTKKIECRRHDDVVRVVEERACGRCRERVERLAISPVIISLNEGEQVRPTVESLFGSIKGPAGAGRADVEILLVDDASADGSCDFGGDMPNVRLLRNKQRQGVGRSRNRGWKESTGHAISFHDAHMRFPDGGLETLSMKALTSGAIICSASGGINSKKGRLYGADLYWNFKYGLQPKYRTQRPDKEWARVPCPMGAGYVMSRETAERLEAATGQLWEDVAGVWGMSEEALAVKAFLLDIPVLVSRDVHIGHHYCETNPNPGIGEGYALNQCRSMAQLFYGETFEKRFRPWAVAKLGEAKVVEITAGLKPPAWHGKVDYDRVFTHLFGWRAIAAENAAEEPHPDHAWLADVEEACRDLCARGPIDPDVHHILQWRPGEATFLVRRLLPDAEIWAIEAPGHRCVNWMPIAKANGVRMEQIMLTPDYARRPLLWQEKQGLNFDLVLVGGEMQEACTAVASRVLRPGGRIIRNPKADRLLICNEYRKEERKALSAAGLGPKGAPLGADPEKPLVTVLLLNWQRPGNLSKVLTCLEHQSVPVQVFLWNNAGRDELLVKREGEKVAASEHPLVARVVGSYENLGCFPRWWLGSLADTEFICSMDDDLIFTDERVLADAVLACREECPDGIIGFFGYSAVDGKGYKAGRHHNGTSKGTRCDIIKGRFMLFRKELLARVPLEIPPLAGIEGLSHREDDVYVSLCISGGRKGHHLIPQRLGKRWKELPQGGTSASCEPGHYARRGRYIDTIKSWLEEGRP